MQLISCDVENFGKISNLHIDFTSGINVINQPNAWGKSTLAAFIKAMFFGFEARKEAGAIDKERNIYRPWQGGVYGGELDFETAGRRYRISRSFGKSEKYDEFHIYDLATNLESADFTERLGEELFDLDGLSFKRSVYIAQNDCCSRTTDAINAKLGNLAENTNDINNYESAQEALKNLLNQLSPSRATGSIKKRKNQLTELDQELRSYEAADFALMQLKVKQQAALEKKERLGKKRDECAMELKLASEASRREEQQKTYLSLCEEQAAKLEALVSFSDIFPMGMPDEEELAVQVKKARAFEEESLNLRHLEMTETEKETFGKLAAMFAQGYPEDSEIDEQIRGLSELGSVREVHTRVQTQLAEREKEALQVSAKPEFVRPKLPGTAVFGIILILAGLIGEILGGILLPLEKTSRLLLMAAGALVFVAGAVFLLIGIQKKSRLISRLEKEQQDWEKEKQKRKEVIEELQKKEEVQNREIWDVNQKARVFLEKYQVFCEEREFASRLYELKTQVREYRRLKEKHSAFTDTKAKADRIRESLLSYGRCSLGVSLGGDITARLNELSTEAARYRIALDQADNVRKRLEEFEARTDMDSLLLEAPESRSLEELNAGIHELDGEIEDIRGSIEQYTRQMEDLQEQLDLKDEKEQELLECRRLQEAELHRYEIITQTQEFLQRAREQFTARYMAPISQAFRKYYELLLGPQKGGWMIDANISFRRKEQGELREVRQLSVGYQDLIGVCMRLALVDAMYQGERPFLILDDPFVNLDEEKTAAGMKLLQNVAEEYQTIYFTCHSSREPA